MKKVGQSKKHRYEVVLSRTVVEYRTFAEDLELDYPCSVHRYVAETSIMAARTERRYYGEAVHHLARSVNGNDETAQKWRTFAPRWQVAWYAAKANIMRAVARSDAEADAADYCNNVGEWKD